MSGDKEVLSNVAGRDLEVNEAAERTKCRATGKVTFNSKAEAVFFIYWLKYRFKHRPRRADGGHRKRRSLARPKQRRAYYCPHCEGYHLTKWTEGEYHRSRW